MTITPTTDSDDPIVPPSAGNAGQSAIQATRQDPHLHEIEAVFAAWDSSADGINVQEAQRRLDEFGPNRLARHKRTGPLMRLLLQFHNPLIYVLIATAGLTAMLQHWVDTGVILAVIVINALIGFIQEWKAERAIESLKELLAPVALVKREGVKMSVPVRDIVPGDVVVLRGGDKVPADTRLFHCKNLRLDEAMLTGESVPQSKKVAALSGKPAMADRTNMAFAGTLVTSGAGEGLVVSTGDETQLGQIAGMLKEVEGVATPLTRRLAQFSKFITIAILALCVLVFALGVLGGISAADMLIAAVALAVSAIPEGLPAIMTIALAIGVKRMASRHAVVRKLPAVEALGSATVICTDKTGTLTRNEMTVTDIQLADRRFTVDGVGYQPTGAIRDGDQQPVDVANELVLQEALRVAVLCNDAALVQESKHWSIRGDPTEAALVVAAHKAGLHPDAIHQDFPRGDAIPFESDQQFMATLHDAPGGGSEICLKGAPEKVFSLCAGDMLNPEHLDVEQWHGEAEKMAGRGLRVLAIAKRSFDKRLPWLDSGDVAEGFTLLGLVGMLDPPREEALTAVNKCRQAGIRVKMVTGDHVNTAKAIASQIGIGDGRVLSGDEVNHMDEASFHNKLADVDVFARVSPAQKLRFVRALQDEGHVVAMTGDGVNDAPALKQADIGVAMGITGTDVSKEAAEIVILDDNFASIERAVEEGRGVYENLKKTILFIFPTNGGECLTLVAALFLGTLLPILPLHILWINLITTVALAITLAFDPVEPDVMNRPPRRPQERLIDRGLIWRIVYVSSLMAAGTFGLFYFELANGRSVEVARGVAVNAIVFFEVFYLFNSRHLTRSVLNWEGIFGNRIALWGIAAVIVLQIFFTYSTSMIALFDIAPLDHWMWTRILIAGIILLLAVEAEKAIQRFWQGRACGAGC